MDNLGILVYFTEASFSSHKIYKYIYIFKCVTSWCLHFYIHILCKKKIAGERKKIIVKRKENYESNLVWGCNLCEPRWNISMKQSNVDDFFVEVFWVFLFHTHLFQVPDFFELLWLLLVPLLVDPDPPSPALLFCER